MPTPPLAIPLPPPPTTTRTPTSNENNKNCIHRIWVPSRLINFATRLDQKTKSRWKKSLAFGLNVLSKR
ncbi:hypothetical protein TIFTF001_004634 [Ficus carica]|uniref:Uncharacterized protein n=1 Tax=Ficus carica TaxID=3494 RepID=A0AA87ZDM5_FICCA|nr:hypothetical protein TIFTF001_004634 [Ficus carica]